MRNFITESPNPITVLYQRYALSLIYVHHLPFACCRTNDCTILIVYETTIYVIYCLFFLQMTEEGVNVLDIHDTVVICEREEAVCILHLRDPAERI